MSEAMETMKKRVAELEGRVRRVAAHATGDLWVCNVVR